MTLAVIVCFAVAAHAERFRTIDIPGRPLQLRDSRGVTHLIPRRAVADRVLVRMRADALMTPAAANVVSGLGGSVNRVVGPDRLMVIDLPAGSDVQATVARLKANPQVALAEPDVMMYPTRIPSDPDYSKQYHLPLIKMPQAWDLSTGSASVVVAIVDAGCQISHPELTSRIWTNPNPTQGDLHGWNFVDGNADVEPHPDGIDRDGNGVPDEQANHGTLVAGTVAATANNGQGGCGIDWNCKIMPIKVFAVDGGSPVSTVIDGINYAVQHKANVINLSLGGGWAESFTAPIRAAYDAGILVVAAAGNEGREFTTDNLTWESPVCNQGPNAFADNDILGVAATDSRDARCSFSNFDGSGGTFVDVCAPGEAIYGPFLYDPTHGFSSYYGEISGTSFSCPMASGVAALILSMHPSYTPAQLIQTIRNSADNIDSLNPGLAGKLGAGRLNAARALGAKLPPTAPTNFTAVDTPGDDGSSITVSWVRSADDGGGAADVTGYTLYRRTATSALAAIVTLPAGSEQYIDTSVTDGVGYYYKLTVSAGQLSSQTSEVGPVSSRNDAPPPRITTLVATDRPGDSGHAILLTWTGYVSPADFSAFKVYRSTRAFATVAGLTPLATITNSSARQYVDTTTIDSTDYYYAVTAIDTAGNENQFFVSVGPVQSYSNGLVSFPAGLSFIGPAAVPTDRDPATMLGLVPSQINCSRWNPSTSAYERYLSSGSVPANLQLTLGHGFWVNLTQAVSVPASGDSAPAGDFHIDLTAGWHQLANPFFGALDFSASTVTASGITMDLATARSRGIMSNSAWLYDTTTQAYRLAYPDIGQGTSLIPPWRGFWVHVLSPCTLALQRPSGTLTASTSQTAAARQTALASATVVSASATTSDATSFSLCLRAAASGSSASEAYCGVSAARSSYWLPSPPPPAAGVQLQFTSGPQSVAAQGLSVVSYASSMTSTLRWEFVVSSTVPDTEITLACQDVTAVPSGWNVMLYDVDGGKQQSLRQQPRYSYSSGASAGVRHFKLEITRRTNTQVAISGLMAQSVRGGGGQMSFTLSATAATSVDIMNIAGVTVRRLETNRLRPAGVNTALWDGRNAGGSSVPSGIYLIRIAAADDSGNRITALRSLNVQR